VRFDWDEAKNRRNVAKHGIHFETAVVAFEDPYALVRLDRVVDGEERWQTIGTIDGLIVLLVAHTLADELIRIISARKATPRERKLYEETN
jgi:uncharacterized DUF497 family protein